MMASGKRKLREKVDDSEVSDDDSEVLDSEVLDSEALNCNERPLREVVDVSKVLPEEWTNWFEIIKSKKEKGSKGWKKKRGYDWYTNVAGLQQFVGESGIYELRLHKGRKTCVVYIGSSCAEGGLRARLSQYARNGSHKAPLIQKALSTGATIEARACTTYQDCKTARKRENDILEKLDYLWNIRNNLTPRKQKAFTTALNRITVYQ